MRMDYLLHAMAGALIFAVTVPFLSTYAMVLVTLVALVKEVRDRKGHGTYEPQDFWWTVAGGAAALAYAIALEHFGLLRLPVNILRDTL